MPDKGDDRVRERGMMASDFARQLRRDLTDAERCLWKHLRAHRFAGDPGGPGRRQEPIGQYVVDFVSHRSRLVVELDGGRHAVEVDHDRERTRWLESRGYRVVRLWDNTVLTETEPVLEAIGLALAPSP
jgi:very-short-patch-repair endonuclease